MYLFAPKASI